MSLVDHLKDTGMACMELARSERAPLGHPVEAAYPMRPNVMGVTEDIRRFRREKAAAQGAAMCNAASTPAFLEAVAFYQDALEQIEREGKCGACGLTLIGGETDCPRCGQDNS